MTAPTRFALVGKSGSGKSEVGVILNGQLGLRIIKTGTICRMIAKMLFGNEDKRSTQKLDDVLTTIDPSIFLRAALRDVGLEEMFVIDALRCASDLGLAQDYGCTVIRVVADDSIRLRRLKARGQEFNLDTDGRHRSEVELDDAQVDHVIANNGTLDDLRRLLSSALRLRTG